MAANRDNSEGRLWRPEKQYESFGSKKYGIADILGSRRSRFLPYYRLYDSLDQAQLLELLLDAKKYSWQALDLRSCGLTELPDELWDLPELQILFLGNDRFSTNERLNEIPVIPRSIERLRSLQALSLQSMPCTVEGNQPLNLPKLRYLDIFRCGFRQIPSAFLLPSLEGIGFNCPEKKLSHQFSELTNLKEAYLTFSNIHTLPHKIDQLQKLEKLYLRDSDITFLPKTVLRLRKLSILNIDRTPLASSLPPEILKQSAQEIIQYVLRRQSDAPQEFFNEAKLLLVGQGHVGKTSLLKRLVDGTFGEEKSTEGLDINRWTFSRGGKEITLNTWDFGGQEIYHATHQFFLTKRSLYLLVWDALAEKEYGRLEYWLKTIESLAGDSPILIVVNKCDRDLGRIEKIEEKPYLNAYPQIKGVYYVSCKDGSGIKALRGKVKELAVGLPLTKTKWLTSWMNVRRSIEKRAEKEYYISYSEYLKLCREHEITDRDEAFSLIRYLHDLGVVLYYHDDQLLKNLVILSSEWGTDAVYKVLDEQERHLKGRNGILYGNDLPNIWEDSGKYPQEYYPYLLSLMKKFQLAFEIDQNTWLVAELLSNDAIEPPLRFPWRDTLSFRYQYDFLPAGVMTRFIVAAHQNLMTKDGVKQCWRKGAYLEFRNARARIRLFDRISERYIQIDVKGTSARDKRDFLSRIRDRLDEINSRFSKIKITRQIPCCCTENCQYLFDYENLLKAEQNGVTKVQCQESWKFVSLSKLLDGVEERTDRNSDDSFSTPPEIHYAPHGAASSQTQDGPQYDVNGQLLAWARTSPLYRAALGDRVSKNSDELLDTALRGDESERVDASYQLMEKIWLSHPEWGLMPNYILLSEFEHGGKFYQKYRDHLAHMFKVFLLGLYLYENTEELRDAFVRQSVDERAFLSIWSIASLYHDVGYVFDTEDRALDGYSADLVCKKLTDLLSHPLHQLYPEDFTEIYEECKQKEYRCYPLNGCVFVELKNCLRAFNGYGSVVGLCEQDTETGNPIQSYYELVSSPNQRLAQFDHGISSAAILLFLQQELKEYIGKYYEAWQKKEDTENAGRLFKKIQKRLSESCAELDTMSRHTVEAARALALHNITQKHESTFVRNLTNMGITIEYFRILRDTMPFAYLLRVCDELQCWDRPYLSSPIGKKSYLKGKFVRLTEKNGHPALKIDVDGESKKIREALDGLIDPPVDIWLAE